MAQNATPDTGCARLYDIHVPAWYRTRVRHWHPAVTVNVGREAALIRTSFVQRSTGRTMNMQVATFMRFADGRVIELKEFSDTFDVVQQALGASLHVPAIAV